MEKHRITIHDIASELNISASTVSRALQNNPRISLSTRDSVQQMAAKYNYQPNVMASSLRRGKSNTVGVIVPRINRNFFSSVIGGMEEVLASSGYHLMICQTHEKIEYEAAAIQTLINARVDAIILSISMETTRADHIEKLTDGGTKLYFFDRLFEGIEADSVIVDNELGGYLVVKHLLKQGYKRVVHVSGPDHIAIYRDRKKGYLKAMSEAGIFVPSSWIIEKPLVNTGGESAFNQAMDFTVTPDSFFCAGDFAALGVLQAAVKKGLRIPEDIGITGFANEPFTEFLQPSLTTVDQKGDEMGRIVANMFLSGAEENKRIKKVDQIVLNPELIIRNSSLLNL